MLDTETKRRIDTARDILVGKLPDPKSQVEQITIALIYKFMDDMDAQSEELGGERTFFSGEFQKYGWARLMRGDLGGHEKLGLYSEAITRMPENPGIPPLFRDIFKNAFLPYRDPETLRAFLKVIDEFEYDHSERLGDAFEYLLSVLGSQGDAGQFRTPRHIIDFIVEVIDPKKDETVLDPACGTAGFLISAYKHILKANTDDHGNSTLTPDERQKLAANFRGYDISPDMVRLSLVNMYLHGFRDPQIHEYDTLTSLDRWNEHADVILANPPFMSPKGGIQPHKRFSVQSKRSEVLFVDYIAEHLTPNGRAGIIVPEGINFQNQTAYSQLRKMLVEDYLVAVISLPAGVFNPYSGVKTSILILDKGLGRRSDSIGFFTVQNDGYSLGAQRRPILANDLPIAQAELAQFMHRQPGAEPIHDLMLNTGFAVPKQRIASTDTFSLVGSRHQDTPSEASRFPLVALRDLCRLVRGVSYSTRELGHAADGIPLYNLKSIKKRGSPPSSDFKYFTGEIKERHLVNEGDVLIALTDLTPSSEIIGSPKLITEPTIAAYSADLAKVVLADQRISPRFLYHVLRSARYRDYIARHSHGANVKHLQADGFYAFEVPLPPMSDQLDTVDEVDADEKVIEGAMAVVSHYSPRVAMQATWPVVEVRDVAEVNPEAVDPRAEYPDLTIHYIDISSIENGSGRLLGIREVASADAPSRARRKVRVGDVLLSTVRPNLKAFTLLEDVPDRTIASTGFAVLRSRPGLVEPAYLLTAVRGASAIEQLVARMGRGSYPSVNQSDVSSISIPLPPLVEQQRLMADLDEEQRLVAANRTLIGRLESRIDRTIEALWGDGPPDHGQLRSSETLLGR